MHHLKSMGRDFNARLSLDPSKLGCILLFMLLTPLCLRSQTYPSVNIDADSTSSRWSFSIEPSFGISGTIPDSGSDPILSMFGIDSAVRLFPERGGFSFDALAGLHYRIGGNMSAGLTVGYHFRGTQVLVIEELQYVTPPIEYSANVGVDYLLMGVKSGFGYEKCVMRFGANVGIPLSGIISDLRGDWYAFQDFESQYSSLPTLIGMQIDAVYPLLKFSNSVVGVGLIADFVFTDMVSSDRILYPDETAMSLRATINYSFE